MQETAQIILQDSLEYPCESFCLNQPTLKRFKVCRNNPQQENWQDNFNSFSCTNVGLPSTKTAHARKTKPANVMKFKNIFAMSSSTSSSSNSKSATSQQQQQTNMRKGKKNPLHIFLKA